MILEFLAGPVTLNTRIKLLVSTNLWYRYHTWKYVKYVEYVYLGNVKESDH